MARTALVTGGSRGIGAAISKALKAQGYNVAATYAGNDEAAAKFTEETGIQTYKWNVGDYDESKAGIEKVEADLGPIDVVVANAGITRDAPFHKMTPEQWHQVIDTNLIGVFNTILPVWPCMSERKFGRIILITSINGQKGQFAQINYAATKTGDVDIMKSLAQEGARAGITANAICPGYVDTPIVERNITSISARAGVSEEEALKMMTHANRHQRLIEPEEVAAAAMWLVGPGSQSINGQTIQISGGQV